MDITEIHESLVNSQRKQMVRQIDDYGNYNFWSDYAEYLNAIYANDYSKFKYFSDAVISYHIIKNR